MGPIGAGITLFEFLGIANHPRYLTVTTNSSENHHLPRTQLMKESLWNLRSPHSKSLITSLSKSNRRLIINLIPIRIMLNHESRWIPPVIEQLRPKDMPSDTPDRLVAFLLQPLVAEVLCVEIMDFEGAVVDVRCFGLVQEEAMVVYVFGASVDVSEERNVLLRSVLVGFHPEKVRGDNVEGSRVELDLRLEVLHAEAVVTELSARQLTYSLRRKASKERALCTAAGPALKRWNFLSLVFSFSKLYSSCAGIGPGSAGFCPYIRFTGNPSGSFTVTRYPPPGALSSS